MTFPGNTPAFPTGLDQAAYWNKVLFGANPSVNGFWNEVSYGQTSASGDVFGPFALSQAYDCNSTTDMQTAAIAAAAGTVDFTQYNRYVIVFPVNSCYFGGLATIGCQSSTATINHQYSVVWLPISSWYGTDDVNPQMWGAASHELGHNLGLNHANTLDFGSVTLGPLDFIATNPGTVHSAPPPLENTTSVGASGQISGVNTEYGDPFSVMGYPWNDAGPYSAEHRVNLLGWIPKTDQADITASGTYTLVPAENSSGLRALHVLRDPISDSWLWLEFHQPTGFYTPDNIVGNPGSLTSGALIHYESSSLDSLHTYLLDMTPVAVSNNFNDGTLAPGNSWSDPYSLLTLTAGANLLFARNHRQLRHPLCHIVSLGLGALFRRWHGQPHYHRAFNLLLERLLERLLDQLSRHNQRQRKCTYPLHLRSQPHHRATEQLYHRAAPKPARRSGWAKRHHRRCFTHNGSGIWAIVCCHRVG